MSRQFPSVKSLFSAAVEIAAPEERRQYLHAACGSNEELFRQVEALLQVHGEPDSLLDQERIQLMAGVAQANDLGPTNECGSTMIGAQIGPYKLLQQIGEGGMGVVFMAEQQQPVRRKVALKITKPGMDTRQVIARFEAERQALSLMDHSNIAKVLDAGATEAGRPYFVMELVRGVSITEYCDECHLTTRERLELFISVCQAVQHAHQKGVIHRDIKPSNVLVAMQDGRAIVKVIDFGVAKAVNQRLTVQTLASGFGQMIGTPLYMSPEQAELSPLEIDTRGDIYSLGVLLYELLTGVTPFDAGRLREVGFDELRRIIREDEPPNPSARISTLAADSLATVASHRRVEPMRLLQTIRGDLDWIVMKALEKDRNRRYAATSDLEQDLRHYLADQPVTARPPSFGYRLQKFVRRNKGPILTASLLLLTLVGGVAGTTWQAVRAEKARLSEAARAQSERFAQEESQKRQAQIEQVTDILAAVFRDLDPMTAEKARVESREILGRRLVDVAQQLDGEVVGDPLVVARLQHLLGVSLRELGHLGEAEVVLEKSCRTRQKLLEAGHLDIAAAKHDLAMLYKELGRESPAEGLYLEAIAVRASKLGAQHVDTLTSQHHLAILYHNEGKLELAESLFKQVLAIRCASLDSDHPDVLASQHRLAMLYRSQGNYAQAETLCRQVLAIQTDSQGADSLAAVAAKSNLAQILFSQGDLPLAEKLHREVLETRARKLGANHPDTLSSGHQLAVVLRARKNYFESEQLFQEVLTARTSKLGASHPATLATQLGLAALYDSRHETSRAEMLFKQVLATCEDKLGQDAPSTLGAQIELARHYRYRNRLDLSIPLLEQTLQQCKAREYPNTLAVQTELGAYCCDARRFRDAVPLLEEVYRKCPKNSSPSHIRGLLLTAYTGAGMSTEATALVAEQVVAAREELAIDSAKLAGAIAAGGEALSRVQAYSAAEPLYKEALDIRTATLGADHHETIFSRDSLATLYRSTGRPDQSIPLLEQSLEQLRSRLGSDHPEVLGRQVTLGVNYCDARDFEKGIGLIEDVRRKGLEDPHPAWVSLILLTAYLQANKLAEANAIVTERVNDARRGFPGETAELADALLENGRLLLDAEAFAEAEPLFLEGFRLLKRNATRFSSKVLDTRLRDAAELLAQLYDRWDKPDAAAKWRHESEVMHRSKNEAR